jgi:hypothetical protein
LPGVVQTHTQVSSQLPRLPTLEINNNRSNKRYICTVAIPPLPPLISPSLPPTLPPSRCHEPPPPAAHHPPDSQPAYTHLPPQCSLGARVALAFEVRTVDKENGFTRVAAEQQPRHLPPHRHVREQSLLIVAYRYMAFSSSHLPHWHMRELLLLT